jgi:hypothetical protein
MRGAGITGADISNDLGAAEGEVSPDVEADVPADTSPIGGAAPTSPSNQPFGT